MSKVMEVCREIDISLSDEVGELIIPQQADLYIEKGLECYQNDEGNVEAEDVGMISEDLCDVIWNITNDCETMYPRSFPAIKDVARDGDTFGTNSLRPNAV